MVNTKYVLIRYRYLLFPRTGNWLHCDVAFETINVTSREVDEKEWLEVIMAVLAILWRSTVTAFERHFVTSTLKNTFVMVMIRHRIGWQVFTQIRLENSVSNFIFSKSDSDLKSIWIRNRTSGQVTWLRETRVVSGGP